MSTSKVAIIMGSTSDKEVMANCEKYLDFFGIEYDVAILSAHRNPEKTMTFSREAESNGYQLIIAAAGMAAHLPGVVTANTTLPVIGVPLAGSALNGVDALYSIVQMPKGVPVGTMGIGKSGAINAAVYAAEILALQNSVIKKKLIEFKKMGCKL